MTGCGTYILCFAHADIRRFAGGLAEYIHQEAALAAERGMETATVFPLHLKQFPRLETWASKGWGVCLGETWLGMYTWKGLANLLGRWERKGRFLSEIQLHHIGGYRREDIRAFLEAVPAPARLFLHDFSTVCPCSQLMRDGREFCGGEDVGLRKCGGCRHWNADWLPGMQELLGGLGNRLSVVAPSDAAAEIWTRSYPGWKGKVDVVPHWLPAELGRGTARTASRPFRLAFAGAPMFHKGWEAYLEVVRTLRETGRGWEFLYFGGLEDVPEEIRAVRVSEGGLVEALRREAPDVLFLWSMCPETYSYVYHEALQAGVWVLTGEDSGNIAAAAKKRGWGTVFPDLQSLLAFLENGKGLEKTLALAAEKERPVKMVPNPRIVESLGAGKALGLPGGRVRRCWSREFLWKLKEWTGHA